MGYEISLKLAWDRMVFWKGDEELPPEASMLFDWGLIVVIDGQRVLIAKNIME